MEVQPPPLGTQKVGAEHVRLKLHIHPQCSSSPGSPCWQRPQLDHRSSSSHWMSSSRFPDPGPDECSALASQLLASPVGTPCPLSGRLGGMSYGCQFQSVLPAHPHRLQIIFAFPALCLSSFPRCLTFRHEHQICKQQPHMVW